MRPLAHVSERPTMIWLRLCGDRVGPFGLILFSLLSAAHVGAAKGTPTRPPFTWPTAPAGSESCDRFPRANWSSGRSRRSGWQRPTLCGSSLRIGLRRPSRTSLIQLANGDRIVAGLSSMSDESVVALWKSYPDLPPVQIPAAAIAGILVSVPDGVAEKTRAFCQVFGRREKSDTVLLVNGDRLAGRFGLLRSNCPQAVPGGQSPAD